MEIKKFIARPVEIEAIQFTGELDNRHTILSWIGTNGGKAVHYAEGTSRVPGQDRIKMPEIIKIRTLEGDMDARVGWWVIRGLKGEFYPCDPEVFAAKYVLFLDERRPQIEVHINEKSKNEVHYFPPRVPYYGPFYD